MSIRRTAAGRVVTLSDRAGEFETTIGPVWKWDAVDVAFGIRSGLISSREAVQASLDRLAEVNPSINAVTVVDAERALAEAEEADCARLRGDALGALHGVPLTIKENVDQAGASTNASGWLAALLPYGAFRSYWIIK